MLRVPIGGCDFSTHPYAYNEQPSDDLTLSNFSLAYEDYQYKIPMIKSILQTAVNPVHILATTWSPPLWMKTDEMWGQENELKPEYYQTYADYHIRFIEEYKANGIPIWGISTTNEPSNGMIGYVQFNSLGWSPFKQGKWIAENLGPTVRSSQYSDLKILANDDNRVTIPWWFTLMVNIIPDALQYIDGIAVHFYLDKVIPPEVLSLVTDIYPDKFLISTEACEGGFDTQKVILGSWDRAKSYITDILQDLNYNVVGWIDWNLCLNAQGGPNWVENFVDSPIIVFPENKEFVKQPMFYALGHFSKFLPRGSQRIKVNQRTPPRSSPVDNVAFLTTRNTVVVILYNDGGPRSVTIQLGQKKAVVPMEARSVVTVEMALKQN
ncbi:unnamed protein product [Chilo suppressalis]|uniref:Glucosylceramidase n=1 Tax=Chilo suppressalis TaxID=168631 RepID=A0ABN8B2X1_CHISP|nr:unnamed protein product [Chilo suppressalis]